MSVQTLLNLNASISETCVDIPIEDDSISEDPQSFTVTITSDDTDVSFPRPMANVTIIDNDNITIGFEREVYPINEDQRFVEVCAIVTEGSLQREAVVFLSTQDGSAKSPDDYTNINSVPLVFDEGTRQQCVNITLEDDMLLEGLEEFGVVLDSMNEPRTVLDPERAQVVITDNDGKINLNSVSCLMNDAFTL